VSTHPIPIRQLWPGFVLGVVLLLAIYLVQFDDGTISRTGLFLHELMHDGRHVLGVPCH
jgi:putative cobalt transporter subunit CbtB